MGKRRELLDESKIEKYIKMGYGSGEGKSYKPWIEIQDFPSLGRVSRIFGWKTNRIHHFLSDLETRYFYILEWSDFILDIREQFPLLDREIAMKIAEEKGIKYPVEKSTGTPLVLTSDFMITMKVDGKEKFVVRTIKPSADLEKKRVVEKFEIERCYWKEKGIDWGIVTENEINRTFALNVEWLHMFNRFEDLGLTDKQYFDQMIDILKSKLFNDDEKVETLLSGLDYEYNMEPGTFLKILKYLISVKQIKINMNEKVNLNQKVNRLVLKNIPAFKARRA